MSARRFEVGDTVPAHLRIPSGNWWLCDEDSAVRRKPDDWAPVLSLYEAPFGYSTCLRCMALWCALWRVQ
jgi:hypothetical protein